MINSRGTEEVTEDKDNIVQFKLILIIMLCKILLLHFFLLFKYCWKDHHNELQYFLKKIQHKRKKLF